MVTRFLQSNSRINFLNVIRLLGSFYILALGLIPSELRAQWSQSTSGTTKTFNKVLYANGTFIAAGNGDVNAGSGAVVLRSTDGLAWTTAYENTSSPYFAGCGVAYATGGWVVGGNWGKALTSGDGVSWTVRSTPLQSDENLLAAQEGPDSELAGP